MSPLNALINYSAELTNTPPTTITKKISSRILTAVCVPFELAAIFENAIKLPFQTTALIIKIPAKICKIVACSATFAEFESSLSGPADIFKTVLKIIGFAIGSFFTASLGILSPYKNFRLHCAFGLTNNNKAERDLRVAEENRRKEIAIHEKIVENRLKTIIDAMRQKAEPVTLLTQEQRQDIERMTHVPCPSIEAIINPPIVLEKAPLPLLNEESRIEIPCQQNKVLTESSVPLNQPTTKTDSERLTESADKNTAELHVFTEESIKNEKEEIHPFENRQISVESGNVR